MTDYDATPEALEEWRTARARCDDWVAHRVRPPHELYSPSFPPSDISDPDVLRRTDSDDDERASTHSVPPKMMLKYADGRPDVPIYAEGGSPGMGNGMNVGGGGGAQRSGSRHQPRSLSRATGEQTLPRGMPDAAPAPARTLYGPPEEIRVLPSGSHAHPAHAPSHTTRDPNGTMSSRHSRRSRAPVPALPENATPIPVPPPVPFPHPHHHPPQHQPHQHQHPQHQQQQMPYPHPHPTPAHAHAHAPSPYPASSYVYVPTNYAPSMAYTQSAPAPPRPRHAPPPHRATPHRDPAIVYAPAHHSRGRYAPPQIVYGAHPGAPSIAYTQSAPQGERQRRSKSSGAGRRSARVQAEVRPASALGGEESRSGSASRSRGSGSTYYVIPHEGQKVQVIMPDGSQYTGSNKSPTSSTLKRPFFQRLLHILSSSGGGGSAGGESRRLRRHSAGPGARPVPAR